MKRILQTLAFLMAGLGAGAHAQLTDTTIVTTRASVPPSRGTGWTDVAVACPNGLVALSGGVSSTSLNVEISTLAPTFLSASLFSQADGSRGAANGWYASVINLDSGPNQVVVSVVCAALPNVFVTIASAMATGGTGSAPGVGSVVTQCPVGYAAVGGGIDVQYPASMKLSSDSPVFGSQYLFDRPVGSGSPPTGWNGNVRNEGIAGVMKVAAVCMPSSGVAAVVAASFFIGANSAAGTSVACPAGSLALGGGVDSPDYTRTTITSTTPLLNRAQPLPIDNAAGSYTSAASWYGIYYNYGPASANAKVAVICAARSTQFLVVYEFFNTGLRHYFRTSSATEAAAIDNGSAGAGWVRTGDNFNSYVPGSASPGSDVCRFYTFGANSHFYTAFVNECNGLKAPNSGWVYEGLSFRIPLPSASGCVAGTRPVYRLYNNRFAFTDSNHRFTTDFTQVTFLQGQGWTYEGIAFCSLIL